MFRLRVGLREGLEWVVRAFRAQGRFWMDDYCDHSVARNLEGKRVGSVRFSVVLAFSSLQMRFGARGLRGVLISRFKKKTLGVPGALAVASSARAGSRGRKRVRVRAFKTACARSAPRGVAERAYRR